MIEVEAKIAIRKPEDVRSKIKKISKYVGKEKKVDDYYTLKLRGKNTRKALRVRKRKEGYEVNIKKKISYIKGVHAKREIELKSTYGDLDEFLEIIEDLGFKRFLTKVKETELYRVGKNERFHIEINKVKGLGWFLEVEYLAKEREIEKARKAVVKVIEQLGLDKKDIIKSGYTKMLLDKKG